ncbi:hypothetical protein D3C72_2285070 [compost metagenome]
MTRPTVELPMPRCSSLRMICGSTASDDAVPRTMVSSSRRYLINGSSFRPDRRITVPSTISTKPAQVR